MKILIASPEAVPYVKTGGLADVAGSLVKGIQGNEKRGVCHPASLQKNKRRKYSPEEYRLKIKVPVGDRQIEGEIFS